MGAKSNRLTYGSADKEDCIMPDGRNRQMDGKEEIGDDENIIPKGKTRLKQWKMDPRRHKWEGGGNPERGNAS